MQLNECNDLTVRPWCCSVHTQTRTDHRRGTVMTQVMWLARDLPEMARLLLIGTLVQGTFKPNFRNILFQYFFWSDASFSCYSWPNLILKKKMAALLNSLWWKACFFRLFPSIFISIKLFMKKKVRKTCCNLEILENPRWRPDDLTPLLWHPDPKYLCLS